MPVQVPNFTNPILNRVAQGDMSILEEGHDFTLTETKGNQDWSALIVAAAKGYFNLVNRLLEIAEVRANPTAEDNGALVWAAHEGHLEVVNRLLEIDAVRANAAAGDNEALRGAVMNGHLDVVNRLLGIDSVRANTAAEDNQALRLAAENGHSEVVHALAKAQWPLGKQDMPEEMQQYLPLIKIGAQLYTAKREQERILIRALRNQSVLSTKGLYAASSLVDDPRASGLFNLPGDVVDNIASYAVYEGQSLADQIRKDDWQNAWNNMRRSEYLHGLFANTKKRSREEEEEHLDCRACKANKVG